jgi:hypothetical protein
MRQLTGRAGHRGFSDLHFLFRFPSPLFGSTYVKTWTCRFNYFIDLYYLTGFPRFHRKHN